MGKQSFTPGPWQLGRTFGQQGLIGPENGYPVASITGYYERNGQSEANAHLIAAAPELYAAGDSLLSVVEEAIASGDWKVDGACDPDADIAGMRAALAKASA